MRIINFWKLEFVQKHSGAIAVTVGLLFFTGAVVASLFATERFAAEQLRLISGLLQTANAVDPKLNRLLQLTTEGFWGKYFFSVVVFLIFSAIAAVFLAIWAEITADTRRPSHILLTRKSEQHKTEQDHRYKVRWLSFLASIALSIVTGIVSNILFSKYWTP